jgi:hypothetical protein
MKLLKRESMSGRAEEMQRVITALRTGSDDQASAILARLRIGDRLNDVLKELPSSVSSPVVSLPGMLRPRSHYCCQTWQHGNAGPAHLCRAPL